MREASTQTQVPRMREAGGVGQLLCRHFERGSARLPHVPRLHAREEEALGLTHARLAHFLTDTLVIRQPPLCSSFDLSGRYVFLYSPEYSTPDLDCFIHSADAVAYGAGHLADALNGTPPRRSHFYNYKRNGTADTEDLREQ